MSNTDLADGTESSAPSPNTSSTHIRVPCFSMYELRHKHFSEMSNNAVYAYTYKHQIKSLKTPSHWVRGRGEGGEGMREEEGVSCLRTEDFVFCWFCSNDQSGFW